MDFQPLQVLVVLASTSIDLQTIDYNRASREFLVGPPRTAAYTYVETMEPKTVSTMDLG
jgi:hypothetical protein